MTIPRRRQKLRTIQNGLPLGGTYEATLERIKAQGGERARLGIAVLMWISHSRQPLRVDELRHAIAIQIGSDSLDTGDIPSISTLLGCCQGLATVDQGASTVKLIHFTIKEYLCTRRDLFGKAHSMMAESCLTYLNFPSVKSLPADSPPDPRSTTFLEYSSLYWGAHMRVEPSDRAKTYALRLLDRFDSHISAQVLWNSISPEFTTGPTSNNKPFSALHCSSYFGIAEVANALIEMNKWDVNQRDSAGMTPLIWAARYGNEEVVGLLLREKHIQPDQPDTNYGRTALSWAAENGHEGVVRLLLGLQFANPGSAGNRLGKRQRVADRLLGRRYPSPDGLSKSGRTPLAGYGREGKVNLLLGRRDTNPDISSESSRGRLSRATEKGQERMVKLLLGRKDVSPDSSSKSGRTPLSWAAENGHEGIVKLLLGREEVNPDSLSEPIRRSRSWDAVKGHGRMMKERVLGRKDVNPHSSSKCGRTPLSWAAENGHEGIVKLLLGREEVNPNSSSESGRTPLAWAATNGHEEVVKQLLEREDVKPDAPDTEYGQTPLSWAAKNGREGVVKLLLEREDVDPNRSSKSGQTPLALAAQNGHDSVVDLLRARHP